MSAEPRIRVRGGSIRTKLTLAFIITALVSVVLVAVGILGLLRLTSDQIALTTLRRQADRLAAQPKQVLSAADESRRVLPALQGLEGTDFAVYRISAQGLEVEIGEEIVPISTLDLTRLRGNRGLEGKAEVSGDEWAYVIRPFQGRPRSLLVLRREVRLAPELTRAIGSRFVIAALLAMGMAAAIAFLFAGRLSRPLRDLARATGDIARGRFERRVPIESNDEIGAVAESFNRMAEGLGDADKRQREFFLSISHELRTPLTAIQGYAEAIEDGTAGEEKVIEAAGVIAGESRRLARLVTDLLELARIDARGFGVSLEDVEIEGVLNSTQQAFAPKAAESGVEIIVDSAGGTVKADPDRLMQVLSNLTENALRYTPAGREIVLSSEVGQGVAQIRVRDGGMGLEPEDLGHAFDRQYLWSKYRGLREVGTGLGLAITKELVEAMGGSVDARNAPGRAGRGAEFTVRLNV